jgi:DMSO/TMAO reductase YedYZ heme-binding membrane subunit
MSPKAPAPAAASWKTGVATTATVLLAALAYAVLRYNVIKGTPFTHLPLLISNKAIALASVALIAAAYALGPLSRWWPRIFERCRPLRKQLGLLGFGLAAVHGIASLLLFSPANYPKFFAADGSLNLTGELSMLFGVLGFFVFAIVAITSLPGMENVMSPKRWRLVQRLGYPALLLVLGHVLVMGLEGWLKPAGWPGGLLPISLVAFIIGALALLFRAVALIIPGEVKR